MKQATKKIILRPSKRPLVAWIPTFDIDYDILCKGVKKLIKYWEENHDQVPEHYQNLYKQNDKVYCFKSFYHTYNDYPCSKTSNLIINYKNFTKKVKQQLNVPMEIEELNRKFGYKLHECVNYDLFVRHGMDSEAHSIFWDKNTFVKKLRETETFDDGLKLIEAFFEFYAGDFESVDREVYYFFHEHTMEIIGTDKWANRISLIEKFFKFNDNNKYLTLLNLKELPDPDTADSISIDDYLIVQKFIQYSFLDKADEEQRPKIINLIKKAHQKYGFTRNLTTNFSILKKDVDLPICWSLIPPDFWEMFEHNIEDVIKSKLEEDDREKLDAYETTEQKLKFVKKQIFQLYTDSVIKLEDGLLDGDQAYVERGIYKETLADLIILDDIYNREIQHKNDAALEDAILASKGENDDN